MSAHGLFALKTGVRHAAWGALFAGITSGPICVRAQTAPAQLAPFAQPGSTALSPAWRFEGLPDNQAKPATRFEIEIERGQPALRVAADNSYGLLVQPWQGAAPAALRWRWRVDQALAGTDIATRAGDDSALKVCVMFDEPLERIPLLERTVLRIARSTSGKSLPSATLCYLWDGKYPAGFAGSNAYTGRLRYIVLRGPDAPLGRWFDEERDVSDDFQKLFGDESQETPSVTAVAVGADSDNTHGASAGWIAALRWAR